MLRQRASFAIREDGRHRNSEGEEYRTHTMPLLAPQSDVESAAQAAIEAVGNSTGGPSNSPQRNRDDHLLPHSLSYMTRQKSDTSEQQSQSKIIDPISDIKALWGATTSSFFNLGLVFLPLGIAGGILQWNAGLVFTFNLIGIIPLALLMGYVTEDLAVRFGDVAGGLLNATFGNVVEMILAVVALKNDQPTLVATSLLGSILSNLLLVLGMCFLVGGLKYKVQKYSQQATKACSSLLFLSCIGIILPTVISLCITPGTGGKDEENIITGVSRGSAIVLTIMYLFYLYFQLYSHKEMFEGEEDGGEPELSLIGAITMLGGISAIVAVASEYITHAVDYLTETTPMSEAFIGMIILPIAGNACEHLTAVLVAYKDKMDLALGVAVGSSIQISLFVLPAMVIVAWCIGKSFMLNFDPVAVVAITLAVIHANLSIQDGTSHWLLGVQLVSVYVLVALVFFFYQSAGGHKAILQRLMAN